MSLDKAIKHGKEHREPYRGAKRVDATCRSHGGCPWCTRGRTFKNLKRLLGTPRGQTKNTLDF